VDIAGRKIQDVCRERQSSEQTFHRWKREFGMLEVDQAKQLKELQKENARLKRILADELLGKEFLKETLGKIYALRAQATDCRESCFRGAMQWTRSGSPFWPAPEHIFL
jgi:putative transposase